MTDKLDQELTDIIKRSEEPRKYQLFGRRNDDDCLAMYKGGFNDFIGDGFNLSEMSEKINSLDESCEWHLVDAIQGKIILTKSKLEKLLSDEKIKIIQTLTY